MNRFWSKGRLWRYFLLALATTLIMAVVPAWMAISIAAEPQVEYAVEQGAGQGTHTVTGYLDQGQVLYDQGRFVVAIATWQQALTLATQQQNAPHIAIAHNYLAISYQSLGQWQAARTSIEQGLQTLASSSPDAFLQAQLLTTQGNNLLQTGQAEAALDIWQQAASIYRSLNATEALARTQINQAQALRTLGFYRQAQTTLRDVNQTLTALPDSTTKVKGLQSLGQTLLRVGDLDQAQAILTTGVEIAHSLNQPTELASMQLSLAQTTAALGDREKALNLYQQASQSPQITIQIDAALQQLALQLQSPEDHPSLAYHVQTLIPKLQALPPSRWGINTQVYLAALLMDDVGVRHLDTLQLSAKDIADLLAQAVQQGRSLDDTQAEAEAIGQLGHLYEQTEQWQVALELTDTALQQLQQPTTYGAAQWQWQRGRILKAQGQQEKALDAYNTAVQQLDALQYDLVALNPNAKFSFRDRVEPVYREYVGMLLTDIDQQAAAVKQTRLQQALDAIDALQLAELQNFFREACLTYKTRPIADIDPSAAIIYPIFLDQRLEIIASLPDQPLQHYGVDLTPAEQETLFYDVRAALHPIRPQQISLALGQQLYDWMIRPIEAELSQNTIDTLVFVPDGVLRNLPMAILHDGNRYLLERYGLALTPGLQLLNSQPITTNSLNVLTAGITNARQGFGALPGVDSEISKIQQLVSTNVLLNNDFTKEKILDQAQRKPFSIIHLATHGQFSASADETFLLTWDGRLKAKDFDQLLQASQQNDTPIELLILSACQTAAGDSRAALGMAGVAIRSGARSTVATLWNVQDESTALLMAEFYRLLTTENISRSAALRQAQLTLLHNPDYQHPYYWAPFVMIGNWQ